MADVKISDGKFLSVSAYCALICLGFSIDFCPHYRLRNFKEVRLISSDGYNKEILEQIDLALHEMKTALSMSYIYRL